MIPREKGPIGGDGLHTGCRVSPTLTFFLFFQTVEAKLVTDDDYVAICVAIPVLEGQTAAQCSDYLEIM